MQYGSFPVAAYQGNTTFPPGYNVKRSYLIAIAVSTNDSVASVELEKPAAGSWFLAAFTEDRNDQVIKKV